MSYLCARQARPPHPMQKGGINEGLTGPDTTVTGPTTAQGQICQLNVRELIQPALGSHRPGRGTAQPDTVDLPPIIRLDHVIVQYMQRTRAVAQHYRLDRARLRVNYR